MTELGRIPKSMVSVLSRLPRRGALPRAADSKQGILFQCNVEN